MIRRASAIFLCILFLFTISVSRQANAADTIQSEEHESVIINGNDDFLNTSDIEGWLGDGTEEFPIVIKGLSIESQEVGIYISNVGLHFRIEECTIKKTDEGSPWSYGIHLENCSNASIENCVVWNFEFGICLSNSNGAYVHRTEIYESMFGVFVNGSRGVWLCSLDVVMCGIGIRFNHSIYVYVEQTIVDHCEYAGFEGICDYGTLLRHNAVVGSENGIAMAENENWVVEESMIWSCEVGISTSHSTGGFILRSMIKNCSSIGIDLVSDTSNITVLECWMGPDNLQNARDNGIENLWCDEYSQIGNYWSDYSGEGPYPIPGSAANFDLYPMSLEDAPNWDDVVTVGIGLTESTTTDGLPDGGIPIDMPILMVTMAAAVVTILVAIAMVRSRVR